MKVHYVMPMAGRGSRFNKDGFDLPKPLLEIYGMPFFYWATRSISKFIELSSINFVVLQEHIEKFSIDKVIKKFFPKARIIALPKVTEGAVITSMKGIEEINDDLPIIFNDCDHLFKSEKFNNFCNLGSKLSLFPIIILLVCIGIAIKKNNPNNIKITPIIVRIITLSILILSIFILFLLSFYYNISYYIIYI